MHKPYSCFGIFYRPEECLLQLENLPWGKRKQINQITKMQLSCTNLHHSPPGAEGATSLESRVRVNLDLSAAPKFGRNRQHVHQTCSKPVGARLTPEHRTNRASASTRQPPLVA
jgi:hypothetical protein